MRNIISAIIHLVENPHIALVRTGKSRTFYCNPLDDKIGRTCGEY